MRTTLMIAMLALAVGAAAPARAEKPVFTIGSYLGADAYTGFGSGETFTLAFTNPTGPGFLVPQPGLRLGLYMPESRIEMSALVGVTVAAASYDALSSVAADLEWLYHLGDRDADVNPYVGLHAGGTFMGFEGYDVRTTDFGLQLGMRRMVADGHGAIRLEGRGGVVRGEYSNSLDLGVRVSYDLWLR